MLGGAQRLNTDDKKKLLSFMGVRNAGDIDVNQAEEIKKKYLGKQKSNAQIQDELED